MFKVKGSTKRFPQVKEDYVTDKEDLAKRSVLDGDSFLPETASWRFKSRVTEPYMPSQAPGSKWFTVKKVRVVHGVVKKHAYIWLYHLDALIRATVWLLLCLSAPCAAGFCHDTVNGLVLE